MFENFTDFCFPGKNLRNKEIKVFKWKEIDFLENLSIVKQNLEDWLAEHKKTTLKEIFDL